MILVFICGTNKSDDQILTQSDFPFDFNEYWTCIRWLKICDINPSRIKSCKLKTIYITGPATHPENMSFPSFSMGSVLLIFSFLCLVCLRWLQDLQLIRRTWVFHRFQWAPCYSSLVFCVCLRWLQDRQLIRRTWVFHRFQWAPCYSSLVICVCLRWLQDRQLIRRTWVFHRFQWAPCYSSLVFCVCLHWLQDLQLIRRTWVFHRFQWARVTHL